jgi:hypothetical protein
VQNKGIAQYLWIRFALKKHGFQSLLNDWLLDFSLTVFQMQKLHSTEWGEKAILNGNNKLTPWSSSLLETLVVCLVVKKFAATLWNPNCSLPSSQQPDIGFYLEPDESSPHSHAISDQFNAIIPYIRILQVYILKAGLCIYHLPHVRCMCRPLHSPWFHYPFNIW